MKRWTDDKKDITSNAMDKDPDMLKTQELISYTNTAQEQLQHME